MRNAYKADHLLGNTCTLTGSLLASLVAQTVKHPLAMWVDLGSIHGLGKSPGGRHGNPLQYSCLENSMDREAWETTVHGVTKSQTRLSD